MFVTTNLTTYLTTSTSHHITISPSHHLNISPSHHHSMYFLNRRPRGFHHTFRFSSEQRDLLDTFAAAYRPKNSQNVLSEKPSHHRAAAITDKYVC